MPLVAAKLPLHRFFFLFFFDPDENVRTGSEPSNTREASPAFTSSGTVQAYQWRAKAGSSSLFPVEAEDSVLLYVCQKNGRVFTSASRGIRHCVKVAVTMAPVARF
jgi:hypothetical protein